MEVAASFPCRNATEVPTAGSWLSSQFQFDLEPRANTVRWFGSVSMLQMEAAHSFRLSPCWTLWFAEKRGAEKPRAHGGAARASTWGPLGMLSVRESRLERYVRNGGRTGRGVGPILGGPRGPVTWATPCELQVNYMRHVPLM
jgi:hypothetical protein